MQITQAPTPKPTLINLASNGIFPIVYDKEGNKISNLPDTGYSVSGTLQGEGKQLGMPCLFVRTSSCNLRCAWVGADGKGSPCDTPYTSHNPQKNRMEIDEIVKLLIVNANSSNINHVIISGGEPTMQTESLAELLMKLQLERFHTTIETNGTIYDANISKYTNLVSISPKLSTSTPHEANLKDTNIEFDPKWVERHERDRKNIEALQAYIDDCYTVGFHDSKGKRLVNYRQRRVDKDFQLKFVISSQADIEEIEKDFLSQLKGVDPTDVVLMPEGVTAEDLMSKSGWVAGEAVARGWRFTPRLHALLWGVKVGV